MTYSVRVGSMVLLGVLGMAQSAATAMAAFAPAAPAVSPPSPATPAPVRGPTQASGTPALVPPKPSPWVPLSQPAPPIGDGNAADPMAVAQAREYFTRGVQDFKDGALEAALGDFQRALELAPSYRLHFNIAQVQYELRNYADAKRSFQRYLAGADAELPADRRAMVEAELAKLDRLVAQFSVKTSVPGVQIAVDGVSAGLVSDADNLVTVNTNPGLRRVSAIKMGFMPASMVVNVAPGERRKLVFELAPLALNRAPQAPAATALATLPAADMTAIAGPPPRTALWVSVASAATLATATGVFALLTRSAHTEFDHQLARVPNEPQTLDDARTRVSRYALIADVLAGATAIATGMSVYFSFADSAPDRRLAVAPAGLGLRGGF
jgi:hypothetical protein